MIHERSCRSMKDVLLKYMVAMVRLNAMSERGHSSVKNLIL